MPSGFLRKVAGYNMTLLTTGRFSSQGLLWYASGGPKLRPSRKAGFCDCTISHLVQQAPVMVS